MSHPSAKQYEIAKDCLRCPFCGGKPYADTPIKLGDEYSIRCDNCSASASPEDWAKRTAAKVYEWLCEEVAAHKKVGKLHNQIAAAELGKAMRLAETWAVGVSRKKSVKRMSTIIKEQERAKRRAKP